MEIQPRSIEVIHWPRIWWIGTGAASSLPFHAAGNYGYDTRDSPDNCLSQRISSYTPSIKSLKHARSIASTASTLSPGEQPLLGITMPTTPGHSALLGVNKEAEVIRDVAKQKRAMKSLAHPTASHVLETISDASIAQSTCHGSLDPTGNDESPAALERSGRQ